MSETPQSGAPEFSRWRSYLWPVHRHELKKLLPMLCLFFLISFNYNVLRTLKDSLLITAKSSGAEVIPFVKVWAMFPGALAMTVLFTWLSNKFSQEKVFYIIVSGFLFLFFAFTFILYPIRDAIHPHALADKLEILLPVGCKGLIALFRYWTFTIFYVASELWSSTVLMVLFWGFANQVTKIGEAKRFYGLFGVGANLSGIFAGQASVYCCHYTRRGGLPILSEDPWHQSLIMIVSLILLAGCLALALFRWMHRHILIHPDESDLTATVSTTKSKKTLSFKESLWLLVKSRYLLCIALIVLAYNLVINLTEVIWKHQVKELYPNPHDYTLYMNEIVSIIGLVATVSSLFISGNAIRKWGWTCTALITPAILALTSIGFFGFFFLNQSLPEFTFSFWGLTPLAMVVFFGSAQNILSRGAKYSLFDATKEMAFVPLPKEDKLVGKAVIDGLCSRMGKSGGSCIHQAFLLFFSTIGASAPYVALALFLVIFVWIAAIKALGLQFHKITHPESENSETGKRAFSFLSFPSAPTPLMQKHGILNEQTS